MHGDGKTRMEAAAISHPSKPATGSTGAPSFAEPGSAARYAKLSSLLSPRAASELPRYLAACGHPDRAVLHMETLLQQHRDTALAAWDSVSPALRASVALFACSPWLGQTLCRTPICCGSSPAPEHWRWPAGRMISASSLHASARVRMRLRYRSCWRASSGASMYASLSASCLGWLRCRRSPGKFPRCRM